MHNFYSALSFTNQKYEILDNLVVTDIDKLGSISLAMNKSILDKLESGFSRMPSVLISMIEHFMK